MTADMANGFISRCFGCNLANHTNVYIQSFINQN